MKPIILFFLFTAIVQSGFTQIQEPVQWSFTSKKINATTYELHITATIEKGWHIYSQTTPAGGPVPTSVSFALNPLVKLIGTTKEVGKLEQHFEPLFDVNVKQFSNKVNFVQTITVKAGIKTSVNGSVEFMVCNDSECLPPSIRKFSIAIK